MADNRMYIVNHTEKEYLCVGKAYGYNWSFIENFQKRLKQFLEDCVVYGNCDGEIEVIFELDNKFDEIVKTYKPYKP